MAGKIQTLVAVRAISEKRWLLLIIVAGALLRLGVAFYLGDEVRPFSGAAYDQIYYHDLALNLLAGKGFVFTRPPWPFIEPGAPSAFYSFLYPIFLAGTYLVFGVHPLIARVIQALVCSLMPWLVYGLTRRILAQAPEWDKRAGAVALVAAGITAGYAYFINYSATLMTEGLYLMAVMWALVLTLDLADQSTMKRWAMWGLAVCLASLLRQVFMPMAGLLFLYILWKAGRRVRIRDVAVAVGVAAILILPWTIRNYLTYQRFLLLNSQVGQTLWNSNHPDHGIRFKGTAMFPIPADLEGANEAELTDELLWRGLKFITDEPWRFALLSLDRFIIFFTFWPVPWSSLVENAARLLSFGVCLPFMIGGLVFSVREWRRWLLIYLFITIYILIHIVSWVQFRYRMPIDVVLVPFAALAVVTLIAHLWSHDTTKIERQHVIA